MVTINRIVFNQPKIVIYLVNNGLLMDIGDESPWWFCSFPILEIYQKWGIYRFILGGSP